MQHKDLSRGKQNTIEFVLELAIMGALVLTLFNVAHILFLTTSKASVAKTSFLEEMDKIIPKGVPKVYGKEIGVSYDDLSPSNPKLADATIAKLRQYEGMELNDELMGRYIKIASEISCEYCCGAKALIFTEDDERKRDEQIDAAVRAGQIAEAQAERYRIKAGDRACGCAHSYAMRGLAKYLLANHGEEMSDEQILEELGKWKVLFFPGILKKKAKILEEKGIELNYINLASNKYRGIENSAQSAQGSSGSSAMVGGC